jgi:hypothetical protein
VGDLAGETALRGLELRPDFTETRLLLGLVLLDMGRPAEAILSFERVFGDNPGGSPLAMTGMVRAFLELGMVPEAEEWLAAVPGYFRHQPSFRDLEEQVRAAAGEYR